MNLTIHGCDELVVDRNLYHPLVRVSIVDLTTGEYWLKSDPERLVLYQSESGSKSKFVLPAMTEPYKMKGTGSSQCIWAEDILYNEKAEVFLKPQALMLFEILEFGYIPMVVLIIITAQKLIFKVILMDLGPCVGAS